MTAKRGYRLLILLVTMSALVLGGCVALPSLEGRTITTALSAEQAHATPQGRVVQPRLASHPGVSGVDPLDNPLAAFAARMLLVQHAELTIDAQYYIWQDDLTGSMLLGFANTIAFYPRQQLQKSAFLVSQRFDTCHPRRSG